MLGMVGIDVGNEVGIDVGLTLVRPLYAFNGRDFHGKFFERKEIRLSLDGLWCSVFCASFLPQVALIGRELPYL